MLDISYVINNPDFSMLYPFKRVTFDLVKGRLQVISITDINIRCVIIPNINQIRKLSEFNFEYMDGKMGVFTKNKLYGQAFDTISGGSVIDFFKFDNVYWQIEEIRNWTQFNYNIAYAKMYETQTLFKELDSELHIP